MAASEPGGGRGTWCSDVSPALDGVDLAPGRRGGNAAPADRILFGEADHNNEERDVKRLVRSGRYAWHLDRRDGRSLLFDVRADPGETVDVSSENGAVARRLREALDRFTETERISETGVTLSAGGDEAVEEPRLPPLTGRPFVRLTSPR